jgi:hypothetical protein
MSKPRNMQMVVRILAVLETKPMSDHELGALFGIDSTNINHYTRRLRREGALHICGYGRMPDTGKPYRLLAAGPGVDAVLETKRPRRVPGNKKRVDRVALIREALKAGATSRAISEKAGICQHHTLLYVRKLRDAKQARIQSWNPPGIAGQWVPVYGLGGEPDAPQPPTKRKSTRKRYTAAPRVSEVITIASARIKPHGIFAALGV